MLAMSTLGFLYHKDTAGWNKLSRCGVRPFDFKEEDLLEAAVWGAEASGMTA